MTLADFDGTWIPRRATLSGQTFPEEMLPGLALVLSGGDYAVGDDRGIVRLMADGPPVALDLVGQSGPNAGRTIAAIAVRDAETLQLCYELGDAGRPVEFTSPPGAMRLLIEFEFVGELPGR